MRFRFIFLAPALLCAACANGSGGVTLSPTAPISATPTTSNPVAAVVDAVPNFVQDAQDAQWNNAQAISVGALAATDPGPQCVNAINTALGIPNLNPDGSQPVAGSTPAAPSFTPKVTGPYSLGSVAYIRLQQLKAASGGLSLTALRNLIPQQCYALIGEAQVDALALQVQGATLAGAVAGAVNGIPPILPLSQKAPPPPRKP